MNAKALAARRSPVPQPLPPRPPSPEPAAVHPPPPTLRPLPPRWTPAPRRPPLWHFVLLSMLLHAAAILMFGAPSGGSREGRAMWGSLNVEIIGRLPESGPPLKLERALRLPSPEVQPPSPSVQAVAPPQPPVEAARAEVPQVVPRLLDRIVLPERKPDTMPVLKVPPPTEIQVIAPPPPVPVARPEPPPTAETPPAVRPPAPHAERAPAEAPAIAAPLLQPVTPERQLAPPVERALVDAPAVSVPLPTPPVERPAVEVPALPAPRTESIAAPSEPTPKAPEIAAPAEPLAPKPPPTAERAQPRVPEPPPAARIEREIASPPALRVSPPSPPAARETPEMKPGAASPDYDPTKAPLDLDAMRRRAGQLAREGTGNRALLPFPMPPQPERKTKEQIAIENARKPDCRTAYQNLGLLAVIPLIANEIGEGSCRW